MKAIRKIKEKQKKEIEQMVDFEVKMNQIKAKNENNLKIQADKEARHLAQVEENRRIQELRKAQDDMARKQKQEAEQIALQLRMEEMKRREKEARKN